jgi:hypothetical protein
LSRGAKWRDYRPAQLQIVCFKHDFHPGSFPCRWSTFSRTTGEELRGCRVRRKRVSGSIGTPIWLGGIPCPGNPARIKSPAVDRYAPRGGRELPDQFPAVAGGAVASCAPALKDDATRVGILRRKR